MELDVNPTQTVLDQIAALKTSRSEEKTEKQREEERNEQLIKLQNFRRKLDVTKRTLNQDGWWQTPWVNIKEADEETWIMPQVMVASKYFPRTYDGDQPVEKHADDTIFVRFLDSSSEEDAPSEPVPVAGLRMNQSNEHSIFIKSELGLTAGSIHFNKDDIIDPLMFAQVMEIEKELLDPVVKAVASERSQASR